MSLQYVLDDEPYQPITRRRLSLPGESAAVGSSSYEPVLIIADAFSALEVYDTPNWDGYCAVPIAADTIVAARRLASLLPRELDVPDIAPGSDGTIGFEWTLGSRIDPTLILVEIGPGDVVVARRVLINGRTETTPASPLAGGRANIVIRTLRRWVGDVRSAEFT